MLSSELRQINAKIFMHFGAIMSTNERKLLQNITPKDVEKSYVKLYSVL